MEIFSESTEYPERTLSIRLILKAFPNLDENASKNLSSVELSYSFQQGWSENIQWSCVHFHLPLFNWDVKEGDGMCRGES